MKLEEQEEFEILLRRELETTDRTIERLVELTKPIAPDSALGRLTRMDAIGGKGINEAALRNAKERKLKLEQAVAKLGTPTFGICEICQRPIGRDRLEAIPESTRCVLCAR